METRAPPSRRLLEDRSTALFLSAASIWEIAVKMGLGRLELPAEPSIYVPRRIADFDISVLDVTMEHALAVYGLPPHHADPFDRMIIAQARLERMIIATGDRVFRKYGTDVVPL
ncbi:MAG: type II toxin-antitoxin system VapC family toxin [Candidatus Eremiobacteraeota bacterium]|nr:type II toxin-antitoxin system VapC family toxin [Candidatus Eremiobacteraeota bacterium]